MRRTKVIAIMLVLVLCVGLFAACGNKEDPAAELQKQLDAANAKIKDLENQLDKAKVYNPNKFIDWVEEDSGNVWRTSQAFKSDAASAPTEAQLKQMLHYASLAPTSGGKTDYYLIAVTDVDEQKAIVGDIASAGTITILVLSDRLYDASTREDGGIVTVQPDRAYYDAGIVSGYLNTAAMALGFSTHYYMTILLDKDSGQFDSAARGYDVSKYTEGLQYTNGATGEVVNVTGNMKFVCAIVIGKLDTSVETSVTEKNYPDNWTIWTPPEPQEA
jgi:hypothetical protein